MHEIVPQHVPEKQCKVCKLFYPATTEYFHYGAKYLYGVVTTCKICCKNKYEETHPNRRINRRTDDGTKQCSRCEQLFPNTKEFYSACKKNPDGLKHVCKQCFAVDHQRLKQRAKIEPLPNSHKTCPDCQKELPITSEFFHSSKVTKDGLMQKCKICVNRKANEYSKKPQTVYKRKVRQNTDDFKIKNRNRYHENKDYYKVKARENRINHPDTYRERERKYSQTPMGKAKLRAKSHRRIAKQKSLPGQYTHEELLDQMKRQKTRCYYCHKKFLKENGHHVYHVDHVIPIARTEAMPTNDINNIVLTCPRCNMRKGAKLPHEWFEGGRLM